MVARILRAVGRCTRCDEPVTLLEHVWHHAGPADHVVEVVTDPVVILEADALEVLKGLPIRQA